MYKKYVKTIVISIIFCISTTANLFGMNSYVSKHELAQLETQVHKNNFNPGNRDLDEIRTSIAVVRIQEDNENLFNALFNKIEKYIPLYNLQKKLVSGNIDLSQKSDHELFKIIEDIIKAKLQEHLWFLYENTKALLKSRVAAKQQSLEKKKNISLDELIKNM